MTKKNFAPKSCSVKFTDSFASAFTVQMTAPVWAVKGSDVFFASVLTNSEDSQAQKEEKH